MYQQYKVVLNTAAGRRRYMQYLIPYVVTCPLVDRYDIWVNTHNGADIEFFRRVADRFPVVNLVWQPDGVVNGNASINAFYKECVAPDTVYFKLDDDIIWMEPGLIERMVRFRVDNPQYFLVSPLVINNALSTYLLQLSGKLRLDSYCEASASHPVLWRSGAFAQELHAWFLEKFLKPGLWEKLHIGKKEMGMTRFSINSVLWFGKEMRRFSGIVPGDDEEFLSCIYPTRQGLSNAWNGDALVAHFAFFTQREALDRVGILEQYGAVVKELARGDAALQEAFGAVQGILADIQADEARWLATASPYRRVAAGRTLRQRIKALVPARLLRLKELNDKESAPVHIVP